MSSIWFEFLELKNWLFELLGNDVLAMFGVLTPYVLIGLVGYSIYKFINRNK
jgi:uncharacterized membrane protein